MLACPVVSEEFQPCRVTWLQMCAQLPYNQGSGSRGLMHLVCVVYGKNDVLHHSPTRIQYHRWLHHGLSLLWNQGVPIREMPNTMYVWEGLPQ